MTATARKPLSFQQRNLHVPLRSLRIQSLTRTPAHKPADQKLVERVRREFSDMRGLSPTIAQARRLFSLPDDECLGIFAQLLQEGFLDLCADDRYRLKARSSSRS
ncbi:MAG TPA: hypothetical protein VN654_31805 [Vicinamibacterales bacterium]|jgi:hypothetical protein|nr:hypothetical protein [Vicinamibacterales bacterium]